MIVANRGVCGIAFEEGEIIKDTEAINAAKKLGERIKELGKIRLKPEPDHLINNKCH
ncbi:MAG: NADPH-dependent FMN reductase [Candidatus Syntrophoarchaeum butanivorans]|nr:MAG: NADPH-dependent FMN reductase [Candidatus Syntrophoarchaeum butanivorans]